MKNIGLMTWYTYHNYGTSLQVVAISNCLKKLGYNPEIIKYIPNGDINIPEKLNMNWIIQRLSSIIKAKQIYKSEERENLFDLFLKKHLHESSLCRTYSELYDLNKKYDAFVCGSDQIWSPICYEPAYFLPFVKERKKMIAYAPSFGSVKIDSPLIEKKIKEHLERFSNLSVRESQGASLIKNLTGQSAEVVLDPTLLMNSREWDEFVSVDDSEKINKKYIICYFLEGADKYINYIKALSKEVNMPYYVIPVTKKDKKSFFSVPFDVGPSDFISLIKYSSYVCTDSFHGMAFSINYHKPFYVFKRFKDNDSKNQNSRVLSLLHLLNLEDRLVDKKNYSSIQKNLTCDFSESDIILDNLKKHSISYLSNALKAATSIISVDGVVKNYKITDLCCGCGACSCVCPKEAIEIKKDNEGFEHSFINPELCVGCGVCKTVCPMINIDAKQIIESQVLYSVKSNSSEVLKKSSSGGIGYELAKAFQSDGYIVCGCTYDKENNSAKHILISPNKYDDLSKLQGSKYIQSISSQALKEISELGKNDKLIFFGTPCQTAAVDKLMRKKRTRNNAVLVDLICHGVPSDFLWKKYLNELDKYYYVGKNPDVIFRNKEYGWRNIIITVSGNEKKYAKKELKDNFYAFFRRGLCYMKSCSECPYRERSAADIRIGDYWGERYKDDKQGVSMVIGNTEKGKNIIENMKMCRMEKLSLSEYWDVQYPYNHPMPLIRDELISELKDKKTSLKQLNKKYCEYYNFREKIYKIMDQIKRILKPGVK